MNEDKFRKELEKLINQHSMENGSDTPDFILADYLMACLKAWNAGVWEREKWYGEKPPGKTRPAATLPKP